MNFKKQGFFWVNKAIVFCNDGTDGVSTKKINSIDSAQELFYVSFGTTVECCYDAVKYLIILHSALQWQQQILNHTLNPQKTPHTSPPGPVFCLLLGVSSDCAQPITGQVTSVTWPVIGWAQSELTPSKRQKTGPEQPMGCLLWGFWRKFTTL